MRPDLQHAMRQALERGPGYCAPDLFIGSADAILLGLKAHANTIAHARHVGLEETFPRTRALLGADAFHAVACEHLADPATARHSLTRIGEGLSDLLSGVSRDLAAVELAWSEAYGAADAPPFDLAAIADLSAEAVASTIVWRHPAAHLIELSAPDEFVWEGEPIPCASILVTRPHAAVLVTAASHTLSSMILQLDRPRSLGDLLELDSAGAIALVRCGAFAHRLEISL